jgi:hypothetical protein
MKLAFSIFVAVFMVSFVGLAMKLPIAHAAQPTVNLGTATPFAILAGSGVTDVPNSVITGDVGLSPATGQNYSGLTKAEVSGSIYTVDAYGPLGYTENPGLLTTAKNDLTTAYTDASGRTPATTLTGSDNQLGGKTLTPGVYSFSHADTANLTAASPLTLSGNGIFIFQATSDLITASASSVALTEGAQACNVFWTVPSSGSSLGSGSSFVGTIMAYSSINLKTSATLQGRVLAQTAAVTLDHNTITAPIECLATTFGGGGSTSVTPKLPNTGTEPEQNTTSLWAIGISSGIIIVLLSFIIVQRKRVI